MIKPEPSIIAEIEAQRPSTPPGLLSKQEKDRLIERGIAGLYRWYTDRSQKTRNWSPDRSFDWRKLRTDHSESLNRVIETFYGVEQYVPDYVSQMLLKVRESYGRSQFHIRWGAEEEKHADLWLNTVMFLRNRTPKWIEDYKQALRSKEWKLPWEDPMHMVFYAVIQERATEINYLNTALIAQGKSDNPEMQGDKDEVLAQVAHTIAIDEAAHYNFYLEMGRLFLYYYPMQALEALTDVLQNFAMPGLDIVPNIRQNEEIIIRSGIYGNTRQLAQDVMQVAFNSLGVTGRRALVNGFKNFRRVPDADGNLCDSAIFSALDYSAVETAVRRLYGRVERYEKEIGLDEIDPTLFIPTGLASVTTAVP